MTATARRSGRIVRGKVIYKAIFEKTCVKCGRTIRPGEEFTRGTTAQRDFHCLGTICNICWPIKDIKIIKIKSNGMEVIPKL